MDERLNAFRAVAEERSFSRAGERIFRTQPAVSQSVASLEAELGTRLFLRRGHSVELTPAGRILLEHAQEAFASLARARTRMAALKELKEGELTLCASDTSACYLLPASLGKFRRRYPGVEVRILNRPSPVAAAQVAAGQADLGIVTLPVEHPRLASERLSAREDVVICSPEHELASCKRVALSKLAPYSMLLLDLGSNTRRFIDEQFAAAEIKPRIGMELGSIEVIKRLVELGFGISIVPRVAVLDEERQGRLRVLRVFEKSAWRVQGLMYPKLGIASRAAEVFAGIVREELGKR